MFYVYHGRRLVGHRCDPVYVHNIAAIQMKFVNPRTSWISFGNVDSTRVMMAKIFRDNIFNRAV